MAGDKKSFLDKKQEVYDNLTDEDLSNIQENMEKTSSTLEESISFVIEKKFPIPIMDIKDIEDIEPPNDIAGLPDDLLTEEMTKWTLLIDYVEYELSKAKTDATAKHNKYRFEKAKFLIKASKEVSNAMAKEHAIADLKLSMLLKTAEMASAKADLMESLLKGYSQNYKLLSRELTKRGLYKPGSPKD